VHNKLAVVHRSQGAEERNIRKALDNMRARKGGIKIRAVIVAVSAVIVTVSMVIVSMVIVFIMPVSVTSHARSRNGYDESNNYQNWKY
jgi:hypothetical protein